MLALWEFFWTEADWAPAPEPVAQDEADEARGSGHKHKYVEPDYYRAGDDFWDVREAYLRSKLPPEVSEDIKKPRQKEPEPVIQKLAERDKVYREALVATDIFQLEQKILNILELTGQILFLRSQYDDEAITLLLLS